MFFLEQVKMIRYISFEEGKDLLSDKDDIIKGGDVSIRVPAFSSKVIAKIK